MEKNLDNLEEALGTTFHDRSLLHRSLVHRSFPNENPGSNWVSNERLEFLGDAVLDFLVAEFLFRRYPRKGEGELTLLRSALVRTETLAGFATQLGLGEYIILGRGEEMDGGRTRPTILADAFEAILGAIFLEKGLEEAYRFVAPLLEQEDTQLQGQAPLDYKSALQIKAQGQWSITPHYRTVSSWGPDHARTFRVEVLAGTQILGTGEGSSKQAAQQQAARAALEQLEEE